MSTLRYFAIHTSHAQVEIRSGIKPPKAIVSTMTKTYMREHTWSRYRHGGPPYYENVTETLPDRYCIQQTAYLGGRVLRTVSLLTFNMARRMHKLKRVSSAFTILEIPLELKDALLKMRTK